MAYMSVMHMKHCVGGRGKVVQVRGAALVASESTLGQHP